MKLHCDKTINEIALHIFFYKHLILPVIVVETVDSKN